MGPENERSEVPMECAAKLPQGVGGTNGGGAGGAVTARVEDAYTTKIEQLWQISNDMETKLDSVLVGSELQEARPMPATKLLTDLERLIDRFTDLSDRMIYQSQK